MPKETRKAEPLFEMVSFRIAIEYYKKLEEHSKTLRDPESGTILTPSLAARKLLVEALDRLPKKKS